MGRYDQLVRGEKAALQEFIWRETNAGDHMGRRKRRLLHFGKIVFRVAVEFQHAYLMQGIFCMLPDLCDVKGVLVMLEGLLFCHDLDIHGPAWIVTAFDGLK